MRTSIIEIATADRRQPVKLFEPPRGPSRAGVIVYMDAFGWRDEVDRMAARYAEAGFTTFLPDLYYRHGQVRFRPTGRGEPLDPAIVEINVSTTVEMTIADTGALLDALGRSRPEHTAFGAVGYCMGARHALGAGASYPDRVRAVACLHGGRLVWEGANSPHRYIPLITGGLYFGFAENDETCPAEHIAVIERTIRESSVRGETEHFAAEHGWTFPTRWCHDPVAAEHAFARVLGLFEAELQGGEQRRGPERDRSGLG